MHQAAQDLPDSPEEPAPPVPPSPPEAAVPSADMRGDDWLARSGHSELAIGSRLAPGARVVRGRKREVISRSYNRLLRIGLGARFSDAQCGFKAIRADAARRLLPEIQDQDAQIRGLGQANGFSVWSNRNLVHGHGNGRG